MEESLLKSECNAVILRGLNKFVIVTGNLAFSLLSSLLYNDTRNKNEVIRTPVSSKKLTAICRLDFPPQSGDAVRSFKRVNITKYNFLTSEQGGHSVPCRKTVSI